MEEEWILHRGDLPGQHSQMEVAALLSTLVDPAQVALRPERSMEVRSDTPRIVYLLNPNCVIHGEVVRTSLIRDGLQDGSLLRDDPLHPALDCRAGLDAAQAIRDWMITGRHYRLEHIVDARRLASDGQPDCSHQRTIYVPGSPGLIGDVKTVATHSLAKAAALGRLGMPLYNITGTREAPQFIVQRYSTGMRDAQGDPVTYDAVELIMGEINDQLDIEHPFMLAYRARLNFEALYRHVGKESQRLIITPDVIKKTGLYDPSGLHSMIDPNAPGKVWDDIEKHFFG